MDCLRCGDVEIKYTETGIESTVLWEKHCHSRFELIAVISGDVSVILEGAEYRVKAGECIIIPPLSYHSVTINEGGVYRRVTALFPIDLVPEVLRPRLRSDAAVFYSSHPVRLSDIVKRQSHELYAPLAVSVMVEIFYDMLEVKSDTARPDKDEFIRSTVLYIDEHLGESITLDELARHTSRSKSSFCHLFEEKMKISPKQYILRKKLATARKMIAEGVPPTLAAVQVGYESYSNFYRQYLKHYGTAPAIRK